MMLGSKGILTLISIAILVNNAFKTVQQSAKDKEDMISAGVLTHGKDV